MKAKMLIDRVEIRLSAPCRRVIIKDANWWAGIFLINYAYRVNHSS